MNKATDAALAIFLFVFAVGVCVFILTWGFILPTIGLLYVLGWLS
jgi:hypothetical protein